MRNASYLMWCISGFDIEIKPQTKEKFWIFWLKKKPSLARCCNRISGNPFILIAMVCKVKYAFLSLFMSSHESKTRLLKHSSKVSSELNMNKQDWKWLNMIEQNCNYGDFNETANGSKKKYVLRRKYLFCLIKYYRYMYSFKEGWQNKMLF